MKNLKRIALFILVALSPSDIYSQRTTMVVTGIDVPVYRKASDKSDIIYWLKYGEEFFVQYHKSSEEILPDVDGSYYLDVLTKEQNKGYIKREMGNVAPLLLYGVRGYTIPAGNKYCIVEKNNELEIQKTKLTLGEDWGDGKDIISDITNCRLTMISQRKLQEGKIEGSLLSSEDELFNPGYYKKIYEKNDTSYYLSTDGCFSGGGVSPASPINAELYITRERKWSTSLLEHQEIKRTNLSKFLDSGNGEKGDAIFIGDIDNDGLLELFISSNRGYSKTIFTEKEYGEFELK